MVRSIEDSIEFFVFNVHQFFELRNLIFHPLPKSVEDYGYVSRVDCKIGEIEASVILDLRMLNFFNGNESCQLSIDNY